MSATTPINGRTRTPRVIEALAEPRTLGLAAALLAFAAEAPKLQKNTDGQAGPRTYKYANLDGVLDDVAPLLVKHQLVWRVQPTIADGQPAARYSMTHVPSGECDEDVMALPGAVTPQTLGSALTYMRRYALIAYLNLARGDDDDGAAASRPNGAQSASNGAQSASNGAQSSAQSQPTARPPAPSPQRASAAQRRMVYGRAATAGLSSSGFANIILIAAGEPERTWETEAAAANTLGRLVDHLPAKLVDGVLQRISPATERSS